jgi:hypothetical protein
LTAQPDVFDVRSWPKADLNAVEQQGRRTHKSGYRGVITDISPRVTEAGTVHEVAFIALAGEGRRAPLVDASGTKVDLTQG